MIRLGMGLVVVLGIGFTVTVLWLEKEAGLAVAKCCLRRRKK